MSYLYSERGFLNRGGGGFFVGVDLQGVVYGGLLLIIDGYGKRLAWDDSPVPYLDFS